MPQPSSLRLRMPRFRLQQLRLQQLRAPQRRMLLVGALLLLTFLAVFWRYYASSRYVYAVAVDGSVVGAVRSESAARQAVEKAAVLAPSGSDLLGSVKIERLPEGDNLLQLTPEELQERVQAALNRSVPAVVIQVSGQRVVAVSDRPTAESVINGIESDYRQRLASDASVKQVAFREEVTLADEMVAPEEIRNADEARRILQRGTDKLLNYTVQRGDSLWRIAQANGLTVDNLTQANPGVNPEALQPGQEINLVVAEPYVHLESIEEVTVVENIPYEVETIEDPDRYPWNSEYEVRGIYGKRQVTYSIKRQDGKVIDRKVIAEEVLSQPERAVYRRGTKLAPKLGTGQFQLPVSGQLTSGYGWRWGELHPGLDIAAPTGTPIYAADAGTVVYSGWNGGYGIAVQIDHGEGKLVTLYGHMKSAAVKVGAQVKKGQLIGYVGNTGRSTGPHVHFEIRKDGKPVNPTAYFPE